MESQLKSELGHFEQINNIYQYFDKHAVQISIKDLFIKPMFT